MKQVVSRGEIMGMGALFHFLNELKTLPIQPVWSVIGLCTSDSLTHAFLLLAGRRSTCSSSFHEIESNKPIQKIKHASNLTRQREISPVSYKGRNMLLFHPIIGAIKQGTWWGWPLPDSSRRSLLAQGAPWSKLLPEVWKLKAKVTLLMNQIS